MIKIKKTTTNITSYHVYYSDIYIGDTERNSDGYYYFYFAKRNTGCWKSDILRSLADMLDELNKEWNDYKNKNLK